jgi:Ca2+-binding EF-hand superfamily protein
MAKDCGALPVLLRLEQFLHDNKLRTKDVFSKAGFDQSGDGNVDAKEFHTALDRLNISVPKKEVEAIITFLDKNGDRQIQVRGTQTATWRLRKQL